MSHGIKSQRLAMMSWPMTFPLKQALPDDGEGYIKVLGLDTEEQEASCVILYTKAEPSSNDDEEWDNKNLKKGTITFARRNAGNDPLAIGE